VAVVTWLSWLTSAVACFGHATSDFIRNCLLWQETRNCLFGTLCFLCVCFVCFAPAQTSSTPSIHGWPIHMASLPSFLDPLPERSSNGPYMNAVFNHPYPLGPAHCLWWPPLKPGMRIETIVLFIPGNSTCFLLCRHRLTHSQETPAYLTFTLLF